MVFLEELKRFSPVGCCMELLDKIGVHLDLINGTVGRNEVKINENMGNNEAIHLKSWIGFLKLKNNRYKEHLKVYLSYNLLVAELE